eukprot:15318193-Alexandrium_andersonii.AAC.1
MSASLVGSEMCIRDRREDSQGGGSPLGHSLRGAGDSHGPACKGDVLEPVSYTHLTLPTICSV